MPLLTTQEKNLTIFSLSTALIGSVIDVFRHNWLNNSGNLIISEETTFIHKENGGR